MREYIIIGCTLVSCFLGTLGEEYNGENKLSVAKEEFNVACITQQSEGKVILMQSARFGQMTCSNDVLSEMDKLCSGKVQCSVDLKSANIGLNGKCPGQEDEENYLEAFYRCIEVQDRRSCLQEPDSGNAIANLSSGFLPLGEQMPFRYYLSQCPWLIQARPGQRIKLYLYDFVTTPEEDGPEQPCQALAIVKERKGSIRDAITVCGDFGARRKLIFTSRTDSIKIMVVPNRSTERKADFNLLEYEVFGDTKPTSS